jgi:phage antirepressor YoqD-like protein
MLSMIPFPYKLLAGLALIAGVFFYGYMKGSAHAEAELARFSAKANAKIAALEKKNAEISNNVVTEYIDRVEVIREKEYVYRDLGKNNVPGQYNLSNGWVYTHDVSASASDADPARASDATSSGIKDNTALLTIVSNYAICQANAEQLRQLQKWITDNKAVIEEEAKKKK